MFREQLVNHLRTLTRYVIILVKYTVYHKNVEYGRPSECSPE